MIESIESILDQLENEPNRPKTREDLIRLFPTALKSHCYHTSQWGRMCSYSGVAIDPATGVMKIGFRATGKPHCEPIEGHIVSRDVARVSSPELAERAFTLGLITRKRLEYLRLRFGSSAVCVVARNHADLYLGVTRKDDPNDWGLPGGKVEPGETQIEAAVRELREETGLVCWTAELHEVFVGRDPTSREVVTAFKLDSAISWFDQPANEGRVGLVTEGQLLSGTYGAYNEAALYHAARVK
jgi:8-oxo-dGTP pyrophosphatase MutT (NUDIX family)